MILVVQRGDVRHGVRPSGFHDPAFAAAAARAATAGVVFRAVRGLGLGVGVGVGVGVGLGLELGLA